jgi:hypothetical protein
LADYFAESDKIEVGRRISDKARLSAGLIPFENNNLGINLYISMFCRANNGLPNVFKDLATPGLGEGRVSIGHAG